MAVEMYQMDFLEGEKKERKVTGDPHKDMVVRSLRALFARKNNDEFMMVSLHEQVEEMRDQITVLYDKIDVLTRERVEHV